MASSQPDAATVALLVVGAVVAVPLLAMLVGFGGTMGAGGTMRGGAAGGYGGGMADHGTGWWLLPGVLGQVAVPLIVLGGGYLLVRRATDDRDPALAELRERYARGDLSDEQFESRRERLERSE